MKFILTLLPLALCNPFQFRGMQNGFPMMYNPDMMKKFMQFMKNHNGVNFGDDRRNERRPMPPPPRKDFCPAIDSYNYITPRVVKPGRTYPTDVWYFKINQEPIGIFYINKDAKSTERDEFTVDITPEKKVVASYNLITESKEYEKISVCNTRNNEVTVFDDQSQVEKTLQNSKPILLWTHKNIVLRNFSGEKVGIYYKNYANNEIYFYHF